MSESPNVGAIPQETLGDRLMRALRHGDVKAQDMAEYLGIHRNSVGAYMNDRSTPKKQTLRLWAMRTGVDLTWLETGVQPTGPQPPKGGQPAETAALRQLTERKQGRARGGAEDTRRYLVEVGSDAA